MSRNREPRPKADGFTLVELMIVVSVIALLAAIAIPSLVKARESSQNARFIADMRTARGAFQIYCIENGHYPPDSTGAEIPPGMSDYLRGFPWTEPTVLGGKWDWDFRIHGFVAAVGVHLPDAPAEQFQQIDRTIDDGNLATGSFRSRGDGYNWIIE